MTRKPEEESECTINAGITQGSILGPNFFLFHINGFPNDILCKTAIYIDFTTLYSRCDKASNFWYQAEISCELESDLKETKK